MGRRAASIIPTNDGHESSWFAVAGRVSIVVKATRLAAFEAWASAAVRGRGVPAPEVLGLDTGDDASFPEGCIVMRRLPGSPLSEVPPGDPGRSRALRQTGEFLRLVHEVVGAGYGEPIHTPQGDGRFKGTYATWPDAVRQWTGSLLDTVVPEVLTAAAAESIRSVIDRHGDVLARWQTSTLLHGDLVPKHVLVSKRTRAVRGLVDFGGGQFGAPAYDIAVFSLAAGRDAPLLVEGYEPDGAKRRDLVDEARIYRLVDSVARLAWAKGEGADPERQKRTVGAEMHALAGQGLIE